MKIASSMTLAVMAMLCAGCVQYDAETVTQLAAVHSADTDVTDTMCTDFLRASLAVRDKNGSKRSQNLPILGKGGELEALSVRLTKSGMQCEEFLERDNWTQAQRNLTLSKFKASWTDAAATVD